MPTGRSRPAQWAGSVVIAGDSGGPGPARTDARHAQESLAPSLLLVRPELEEEEAP